MHSPSRIGALGSVLYMLGSWKLGVIHRFGIIISIHMQVGCFALYGVPVLVWQVK